MRQLLSFGHVQLLSSDSVEVVIDTEECITTEGFLEFNDVILPLLNKPYALLLNMVNDYQISAEVLQQLSKSSDIGCIALLGYFSSHNKEVCKSFPACQYFDGFQMGRSDSVAWLELELSKLVNSQSQELSTEDE